MVRRTSRPARSRLQLEQLEDRTLLSVVPNDPQFASQYYLQNTGQTGGTPGADIHAPAAWSVTTGSRAVPVAVIDTGIDYAHPDLWQNIWLNDAEIPASRLNNLLDVDGDGIITFADLQDPRNQGTGKITDLNHDGRIDARDILQPMVQDAQGNDTGLGGWAYPGNTQDGDTAHPNDFVGWNFVTNTNDPLDINGHGTNVAGVIGAMGNNGTGVTGINWQSSLMAITALDNRGQGTASWLIAALQYARLHGAKIINNSWGNVGNWPAMLNEIKAEQQAGEIFVAAAGNGAANIDSTPFYPPSFGVDNIVAVAATDAKDQLANFSNYGPNTVALAAPGVSVLSTYAGKSYNITTGTSMSAPMASGVLALVWGQHPTWSYKQVIDQVLSTVDKLPSLAGKVRSGGRLNAAAAVGATATPDRPAITSCVLLGPAGTISTIRVTFNKPVIVNEFSPADIFFTDAAGDPVAAQSVTVVGGSGNTVFDIVLPAQTATGVYHLKIGPEVFDTSWQKMVVFQTTFTLGNPPPPSPPPSYPPGAPYITSSLLLGPPGTVSTIRVTFDKPIIVNEFSPADVFFTNPAGEQVVPQSVTVVAGSNNTAFDIVLPAQTATGLYRVKIGPEVFDTSWQKMIVFQWTFTM